MTGVPLARAVDLIDHYWDYLSCIFTREYETSIRVPEPHRTLCKRLRSLVHPDIDALLVTHPDCVKRRVKVWSEVYGRTMRKPGYSHRFSKITQHQHYRLDDEVQELLGKDFMQSLPRNLPRASSVSMSTQDYGLDPWYSHGAFNKFMPEEKASEAARRKSMADFYGHLMFDKRVSPVNQNLLVWRYEDEHSHGHSHPSNLDRMMDKETQDCHLCLSIQTMNIQVASLRYAVTCGRYPRQALTHCLAKARNYMRWCWSRYCQLAERERLRNYHEDPRSSYELPLRKGKFGITAENTKMLLDFLKKLEDDFLFCGTTPHKDGNHQEDQTAKVEERIWSLEAFRVPESSQRRRRPRPRPFISIHDNRLPR